MKFLFWNIRGLGKAARRRQLKELVITEKLDAIGVQETIKKQFCVRELRNLVGNLSFKWHWIPAVGHSGGILLGVKEDFLEVESCDSGNFFVSMGVRSRLSNFRWELIVVYGLAHHDMSQRFLEELDRKCKNATIPLVMGGDLI